MDALDRNARRKKNIIARLKSYKAYKQQYVSTHLYNQTQFKGSLKNTLTSLLLKNQTEIFECRKQTIEADLASLFEQLHCSSYVISNHPKLAKLLPSLESTVNIDGPWSGAKAALFSSVPLSVCYADAAICEQGALLVKADANQPRNLSLVPTNNVLIVEEAAMFCSLETCIESHHFDKDQLPSNMFFISGPSKTADIQQTLAYGAHGPKRLFVFLVS